MKLGLDRTCDFQIIYLEVMWEGKGADVTREGEKTKQKANKFLDEYLYLKEGVKPDIGSKTGMRMKD